MMLVLVFSSVFVFSSCTDDDDDDLTISNSPSIGVAKRTGNIDVKWVQLWKKGPKFAEYNVGAANNKAEDYGGYYSLPESTEDEYKGSPNVLRGNDDIATNLWGSNWRMPTKGELQALLANCDVEWTTDYEETGIEGLIFTGKGDYASNSVFLPAAGYRNNGYVDNQGYTGNYWSATPNYRYEAYRLHFLGSGLGVSAYYRSREYSIRAVLAK